MVASYLSLVQLLLSGLKSAVLFGAIEVFTVEVFTVGDNLSAASECCSGIGARATNMEEHGNEPQFRLPWSLAIRG